MEITNTTTYPMDVEAVKNVSVMTDRLKKRLKEWQEATPKVSSRSSRAFTESWKQTEGLHVDYRWAKASQNMFKAAVPVIREGELIVGSQTPDVRGADVTIAADPVRLLKQLDERRLYRIMSDRESASISEEDEKVFREDAEYWIEHLEPSDFVASLKEELGEKHFDLCFQRSRIFGHEQMLKRGGRRSTAKLPAQSSECALCPRLLNEGLNGIIARVKAELDKMVKEGHGTIGATIAAGNKYYLLKSMIIALEAVIDWANRHAEVARSLAEKESDPVRKKELEKIAEHCNWVPANPPRSFWEAVQFVRFIHLAHRLEVPGRPGGSIGRLDQYLYPYYEKDLREGKITAQEAAELLGCLWLKTRELETLNSFEERIKGFVGSLFANVTIGGQTKEGRDATNELSWIILEVMRQMKLSEPSVYIRYHSGMSHDFLIHALECNRDFGGGNPAFMNDEIGTAKFIDRGVTLDDATEWVASGCLGINLAGIDQHNGPSGHVNQAKVFEVTLYNGFDPRTGKQVGLKTGDVTKFTSIDQLYEAFLKQSDYFTEIMRKDYFIRRTGLGEKPNPAFGSSLFPASITTGLGPGKGGVKYACNGGYWVADRGTSDVTDSLAAIKYLVFDKKKLTMAELLEALKAKWEGHEDVHQMCLKAPKFGNDDDYVDDIFNYISLKTQEILLKRPDPFTGEKPFLFKGAAAGHIALGEAVGALPNGRTAYTSLNDGFSSAMPGMDVKGPTAVINSATKVDHTWNEVGFVHNMKFSKSALNTREKLDNIATLIKTYFARGGWHIQCNIHSAEELLEAKKHPEKYEDLIVRVAGFCAYFVDLEPSTQDEIISRTLHAV
jgi:pyruvate formate-lyase/glycerol dehydratase family glycyl radical enzyme